MQTKRYPRAMGRVPVWLATAVLSAIAIQVIVVGGQLEAAFAAGMVVGAGLLR
jgi:hypothetical protein